MRVRFAPSPTGYLHIGGARTALFNWLYARRFNGTFILRIEDTDVERSKKEYVDEIIEGLKWLGMEPDEGPYFQSQRIERYKEVANRLLEEGLAYRCYCSPEELEMRRREALKAGLPPRYDGRCRETKEKLNKRFAIRFMTPKEGTTTVDDLIRGKTIFQNSEIEDFVIIRNNGLPTYNLSVVVDDSDMGITHVIRGEDHLANTPKQILLYKALSLKIPAFAHVPLILGPDRTRLSKRHGATALLTYREEGYLPEAMINFLVRLGWSYGDREFFTVDELIKVFDIKDVGRSPAIFNLEKLRWLNQEHMKSKPSEELFKISEPFFKAIGIIPVPEEGFFYLLEHIKVRARTLKEIAEMSLFYFKDDFEYDENGIKKYFDEKGKEGMKRVLALIDGEVIEDEKKLEEGLRKICDELGVKLVHIAQAVRLAITGKTVSPGIFEVMKALGKKKVKRRIEKALLR